MSDQDGLREVTFHRDYRYRGQLFLKGTTATVPAQFANRVETDKVQRQRNIDDSAQSAAAFDADLLGKTKKQEVEAQKAKDAELARAEAELKKQLAREEKEAEAAKKAAQQPAPTPPAS